MSLPLTDRPPRPGASITWGYPGLLLLLLLAFAIQPIAARAAGGILLIRLFFPVILLGALFAVSANRRVRAAALALLVPSIALGDVFVEPGGSLQLLGDTTSAAFLTLVILALLRAILAHRHVTFHTLCGSLSTFLLMGILWTQFYQIADTTIENAFTGLAGEAVLRETQIFYFSFVTLTTLGYGDVTPTAPETMSLASVEAILGQMYMVVLVAYLVARLVAGQPLPGSRDSSAEGSAD